RRFHPELELGPVDARLRGIDGVEPGAEAARQREGIEKLLILVVVVERRDVEPRPPVPELRLKSELVGGELLGVRERELGVVVIGLPVEGDSAVTLTDAHVREHTVAGFPVEANLAAHVIGVVLECGYESKSLHREPLLEAGTRCSRRRIGWWWRV